MDPGKESCCALRASQVGNIFDPRTLHKYVYTANNPVNAVDPTGRDTFDEYGFVVPSKVDEIASIGRFAKAVLSEEQCIRWALAWMAEVGGDPGSAWLMYLYCMGGFN